MKNLIFILLLLFGFNVHANSLDDQISQFANIQSELELDKQKQEQARRLKIAEEIRISEEKAEKIRVESKKKSDAIARANANRRKKEQAAKTADKVREQSFEDELRSLQIENLRADLYYKKGKNNIDLKVGGAKADRVEEYIDSDLNKKAAETDVIQSTADGVRNVTEQKGFFD